MLLVGGCGGSGLVDVRGKVTYDGQPVQRGTIAFFPSDGKGPTTAALITNGRYMLKVPLGRKRVKIEGGKVVGRQPCIRGDPASPMIDITEPIVPAQYNENSKLTAEIRHGVSVLDFNLKAAAR